MLQNILYQFTGKGKLNGLAAMNKIAKLLVMLVSLGFFASDLSLAKTPAKRLFGAKALPAAMEPKVHGFYSKGCIAGAVALPLDGPNWQTMRLSRNRRWGHPTLINIIEDLSYKAKKDGWNGILVGDISQPRGGPMLTGHRSHQLGLDSDLWFTPMPDKRMSYKEREETSAVSVLKKNSFYVDDARWTRSYTMLLYHAANYEEVERILVHPGVKKKLCDTVQGDRKWLNKIRPFWGHHYHFHLRIGCPPGSTGCKPQKSTGSATGCDDSLDWWFNVGLKPPKDPAPPAKKRKELVLSDLPQACAAVLNASDKNLVSATHRVRETAFVAPKIDLPKVSAAAILNSIPIEASSTATLSESRIPIPTPRPKQQN